MVLDKGLLLKGLAGVAALGGVGGVGGVVIKNKLDERAAEEKKKEDEQNKQKELEDKKNKVNGKLTTLGLDNCLFGEGEITDSTTFSKDCKLDKTKFQAINFSNKPEASNVTVEGWDNQNSKINLKIENKDQDKIKFTFSNAPSNLIVKGGDNKFSIKANKETEFEENPEGKLSKKVNGEVSSKLKGYNDKFQTLALPNSCKFDDTEDEKKLECDVAGSELKKIKFSNKADSSELQLTGLTDSDKIKLIIDREGSETSETLKYKFKNETSSNITLTNTSAQGEKITLRAGTEREFEESDSKLKKKANSSVSSRLVIVNDKLDSLKLPDGCRFDDTEEDTSIECDISESDFKKIKFSNKADDGADLTVAGWNNQGNIKLKVERVSGGDGVNETLKYLFKDIKNNLTITGNGSKSQDKITLKKGSKEFKEEEGKLSKVFDKTLSEKLKGFNNNLGDLSVPGGCRFDDTESDEKLECNISEEQIKKIKFWNKGEQNQDLEVSQGTGFTGLKLVLSKNGESLKYTFKDANRDIKLSHDNKTFTLKAYTDAEFEFKDGVLQRPRKIEGIAKLVGLTCTYTEGSKGNTGTCTLGSSDYINVSSNGTSSVSISFRDSSKNKDKKEKVKFDFSEYEYDYENNVKFTYTGEEKIEDEGEKLETNVNYEVKKVGLVDSLSKKILESQ